MKVLWLLTNLDGRWASIMPLSLSLLSPSSHCSLTETEEEWNGQTVRRPVPVSMTFYKVTDRLLLRLPCPCLSWLMLARRRTMCWVDPLLPLSCLPAQVLLMSQGPHKLADHQPVTPTGAGTYFYGTLQRCRGGNKHILRRWAITPCLFMGNVLADEWGRLRRLSHNYCSYILGREEESLTRTARAQSRRQDFLFCVQRRTVGNWLD